MTRRDQLSLAYGRRLAATSEAVFDDELKNRGKLRRPPSAFGKTGERSGERGLL